MAPLLNNAEHWLQRAQEARRLADGIDEPEAKQTLLKIADDYERLAQRASNRGGDITT